MSDPAENAASITKVPFGTETDFPSTIKLTIGTPESWATLESETTLLTSALSAGVFGRSGPFCVDIAMLCSQLSGFRIGVPTMMYIREVFMAEESQARHDRPDSPFA